MNKLLLYFIALILYTHFSSAQLTVSVTPQTQCFSSSTNSVTAVVVVGPPSAIGYSWTIMPGLSICTTANSITVISPTMAVYRFGCCGTYTLNCSAYASGGGVITSTTVVVSLVCPPNFNATAAQPLICMGGTSTLSASGTGTYTWSTGTNGSQAVVSPTVASVYTVTGTFSGGCTSTKTVAVNIFSPTFQTSPPSATVCSGGVITLIGSGAISYTWNTGSGFNQPFANVLVTPTASSIYTVAATSVSNNVMCVSTRTVGITLTNSITITAYASPTAACAGSTVTLIAQGASGYTWSTAQFGPTITVVVPAIYPDATFIVAGGSGTCVTNTVMVTVSVLPPPTITLTPASASICAGKSIVLTAGGALSYTWSNTVVAPSVTLNPLVSGVFSVSGTGSNGCKGTATCNLVVNPLPTVTIVSSNVPVCSGKTVTLTANGAQTYTWSTTQTVATITLSAVAGNYSVSGVDANNCVNTASIVLTVNPSPSITAVSNKTLICAGEKIILTPGGGVSYTWSPIAGAGSLTLSPISTTQYTLLGENSFSCSNTAVVTVTVNKCQDITGIFLLEGLKIYPNPAAEELHFDLPELSEITILNSAGEIRMKKVGHENKSTVMIHDLEPGLYLVHIQSLSRNGYLKFVKQ